MRKKFEQRQNKTKQKFQAYFGKLGLNMHQIYVSRVKLLPNSFYFGKIKISCHIPIIYLHKNRKMILTLHFSMFALQNLSFSVEIIHSKTN